VCGQSVEFSAVKRGFVSQLPEDGRKICDMIHSFTAIAFLPGGSGFTSLHFTFFTSLYFWTFRHHVLTTLPFSSLIITFLALFYKICDLQGKVASTTEGYWFHSLTVLYT
jgi:hypothetical protein